jgi:hypothetical protein
MSNFTQKLKKKVSFFNKLIMIKELMLNKKHLLTIGKYRQWNPEIKLYIIDISLNQNS